MPQETSATTTHVVVSENVARLAHMLGFLDPADTGGYVISDKGLQLLLDYSQVADSP